MSNPNAYIIFEADQVLTNDHLNDMFDYLDVQERLTRNSLIGIGIVCGLEIDTQSSSVNISKGCGVTSKGYLIKVDDLVLTQHISYTLPSNPLYKPFIDEGTSKQYPLRRLLTAEEAKTIEGAKDPVTTASLKDKVVVLFLEANEIDLKNCDTQDCNEKGRQMEFNIRPLLINKDDMEKIILKQKKLSGEDGLSDSYIERLGLKEIALKRFDVKATPLATAYDIYNAYIKCLDDPTLKSIADAYSQCYSIFKPILSDAGSTNPFKSLEAELKSKLEYIRKSMPIYIQYYYDFLDDLIKAYNEFKERSFEVITECCPDEDLFPMHLMLGEATVDTKDYIRSPFRQYFISSPLFNNQRELLNEVKVLFEKMVNLVKGLFISQFTPRQGVPIRITPSKWSYAPLSARAIPYYYNINNVAKSWNADKTRKGRSNYNLSYNADKYPIAPPDTVLNPLLYSIEQYNFFRIEGHIGQPFTTVLNTILSAKNTYRLPFDVIALKAGADAENTTIKYECHFEDLEALFDVIKAELACKMHEPVCLVAKVPTTFVIKVGDTTPFNFTGFFSNFHAGAMQDKIDVKDRIVTNFAQKFRFTKKGDFLKTYCPIKEGTLGGDYMKATTRFFPRPTKIDLTTIAGAKAALFHMIDIVEALMQTITGAATVHTFNYTNFNRIYDQVISYFTDFMQALLNAEGKERLISPFLYGVLEDVVNCCIDEKLKAVLDEYAKRVKKIQKQNLLSEYLKNNPGIDHKAGVPRGGTFVIVYHERPVEKDPQTVVAVTDTLQNIENNAAISTAGAPEKSKSLAETSAITKDNAKEIMKLVDSSELKLSKSQSEILEKLVLQSFGSLAQRDPFTIQDKAVVADFFLPYLCCSDCPPVAYILPKIVEPLTLNVEKTDFCNNDDKTYNVTVTPAGGTLTASAGGVEAGKLEFKPKGLAAGVNKLTYKVSDGRTISIDLKITASFEIDFKTEKIDEEDIFTIRFIPSNAENKVLSWNFGDGTPPSTESSPVHTYQIEGDEQTFTAILTATEGPCTSKKEQAVVISKPQTFTIRPNSFCSNDEQPREFIAKPAVKNITDIENKNGLQLELNDAGRVFFVPAKQGVQQETNYHLVYRGAAVDIKIVPAFEADFTHEPNDGPHVLKFIPSNVENKSVLWDFGDGQQSDQQSPVHGYQLSDDQETFVVTMTVTDGPCVVEKKQSITLSKPKPQIFTIDPNVFCSNDDNPAVFTIDPAIEDIGEITNIHELMLEKSEGGSVFFVPSKQGVAQTSTFELFYKDAAVSLTIVPAPVDVDFKFEPNDGPFVIQFFPVNTQEKPLMWDFGDGQQSDEQAPVHSYQSSDNEQTFKVTMTLTDGPCRVVVEHELKLSFQKETVFSIEPRTFCANDKEAKSFTVEPTPGDIKEIENPNKLNFEIGSTGAFFVPAKQDISNSTTYLLSYRGVDVDIKIIVPNADFTMNIQQPSRGAELVLVLKAKQTDADDYKWRITRITGTSFDLVGKEVVVRYNQMNIGFAEQVTIDLVTNYKKQTGVTCSDHKNYVLTEKIFRNHFNSGEFDNNTPL